MPGKILNGAAEVYYKPSTGQLIIRRIGLDTSSEKWQTKTVPKINKFVEVMSGNKIADSCECPENLGKGECFKHFRACLRKKGKDYWAEKTGKK